MFQNTYCSPVAYVWAYKKKMLIAQLTDVLVYKFLLAVRAFCAPLDTFLSSQWSINYFPNYCQAVDRVLRIIPETLHRFSAGVIKFGFQRNGLFKNFSNMQLILAAIKLELIKIILMFDVR